MRRRRAILGVVALGALSACGVPSAAGEGGGGDQGKVFVCKYVGTPGVDERLQTGQNPISVSVNAIPGGAFVGKEFADAQGRSLVIAFDTGQPEPECPGPTPHNPTTTTQHATTTTAGATTTTAGATTTTQGNTTTTAGGTTTTVAGGGGTTTTTGGEGTTTTSAPAGGTTTTTEPGGTTTTTEGPPGGTTTTTLPPGRPSQFSFGAAATVCVEEVPTIRITFVTPAQFPELVGETGTLTMADVDGNVVSTQPLDYLPGATIDLLYPGTEINADGSIADVPGWNLNEDGFWVRDPSDEFLRDGINLTYTVNPTATAFVTYPPESANCANPDGPFPPGPPPAVPTTTTTPPRVVPPPRTPPGVTPPPVVVPPGPRLPGTR